MRRILWALSATIIGILGAGQAQAEPCGSTPIVANADCTAAGNPYPCCTGAGTGTCSDPGVVAPNCIDCSVSGGCRIYKYGLGHPDNFDYRRPPGGDPLAYDDSSFPTGSYALSRQLTTAGTGCGPENSFSPIQGQVVLREQPECVPTSRGPICSASSPNAGRMCYLMASQSSAPNTVECGTGGTCERDPGTSCPVEMPRQVSGITPREDKTAWSNGARVISSTRTILASSSATLGGTSNPLDPQCPASNIRLVNARGTRYVLPASAGGDGTKTYIMWRDEASCVGGPTPGAACIPWAVPSTCGGGGVCTGGGGLYRHDDDSELCCTSPTGLACTNPPQGASYQEYPINTVRNCTATGRIFQLLQTNRWIFEGGPGTPFITDPNHIVPGNLQGVCQNFRQFGCTSPAATDQCTALRTPHACCTGNKTGTCGTECNIFGDTCDLRERGIRQTLPANLASGFPNPNSCNTFLAVLRGTPEQYCMINGKYTNPGDPGPGCLLWNFGFRPRPDLDCDGVEDAIPNGGPANDLCPFFNEYDYFKDTDGDCALGRCRGDECECTDHDENGKNTVVDIVDINLAIFDPTRRVDVCDGNNDLECNVTDIVAANLEIYVPDSSTCRHLTSAKCGNSSLEEGEACDDGAECVGGPTPGAGCDASAASTCGSGGACTRLGGDGCNSICRVEAGWTCSGSPSVCTRP